MEYTKYTRALVRYLNAGNPPTTIIEPTKVDGLKVEFNLTQPRSMPLLISGSSGTGKLRVDFGSSSSGDVIQIYVGDAYRPLDDVNTITHFVGYITQKVIRFSGLRAQLNADRSDPKFNTSDRASLKSVTFLKDWTQFGAAQTIKQFFNNFVVDGTLLNGLIDLGAIEESEVQRSFNRNAFFQAVNQLEEYIKQTVDIQKIQQEGNSDFAKQFPKLLKPVTEVVVKPTKETDTEVSNESTDATSKAWIALGAVGTLAVVGFAVHRRRNQV